MWRKNIFDIYVTEYGTALTTILPILFLYLNTVIVTAEPLNRNESGRFGALKSDSTYHFFRNACTKSGSLRFSQFSGCWLILSVYIIMFWLSLCKIVRSSVILLLPLLTNSFSIKFLYFFIISSLFHYFNLFVSIFIQSYVNNNLHVSTLYLILIIHKAWNSAGLKFVPLLASSIFIPPYFHYVI